jgi:hypothetical protein
MAFMLLVIDGGIKSMREVEEKEEGQRIDKSAAKIGDNLQAVDSLGGTGWESSNSGEEESRRYGARLWSLMELVESP